MTYSEVDMAGNKADMVPETQLKLNTHWISVRIEELARELTQSLVEDR